MDVEELIRRTHDSIANRVPQLPRAWLASLLSMVLPVLLHRQGQVKGMLAAGEYKGNNIKLARSGAGTRLELGFKP